MNPDLEAAIRRMAAELGADPDQAVATVRAQWATITAAPQPEVVLQDLLESLPPAGAARAGSVPGPAAVAAPPAKDGAPAAAPAQGETVAALIRRVAREEGVDPNLALAIAWHESSFNPAAAGDWSDAKKRNRSIGLFQLNEEGMGAPLAAGVPEDQRGKVGVDPRTEAETNARVAIRHLAQTQKQMAGSAPVGDPGSVPDPGALAVKSQNPDNTGNRYANAINGLLARGLPKEAMAAGERSVGAAATGGAGNGGTEGGGGGEDERSGLQRLLDDATARAAKYQAEVTSLTARRVTLEQKAASGSLSAAEGQELQRLGKDLSQANTNLRSAQVDVKNLTSSIQRADAAEWERMGSATSGYYERNRRTGEVRPLNIPGTGADAPERQPAPRTADQARLDKAQADLKELELAAKQREDYWVKQVNDIMRLADQGAISSEEASKRIQRIQQITATAAERATLQVQRETATGLQQEFDATTGAFRPKAAPRTPVPGQDAIDNGDTTATTVYSDGSTEVWVIDTGETVKTTPATKPAYLPTAAEEARRRTAKTDEERLGLEKGRAAREETAQQQQAVAAAEKATGYRHQWNAETGQVEFALDENGQRQQTAEREQKERQSLATNTQKLADWEQQRQSTLASAAGQFAQYGVATAGPVRNLNALATPLPKEVVLAALGLGEGDQRGEAIYNVYAQLAGGKLAPGAAQGALGAAAAGPSGTPGAVAPVTGAPAPPRPVNGAAGPPGGLPSPVPPPPFPAPPAFTAPRAGYQPGRAAAIGAAFGPVSPVSERPAPGGGPFVAPGPAAAAAPAPAAKTPVPGQDQIDLGNGMARTYYTDGSYEDWPIPAAA